MHVGRLLTEYYPGCAWTEVDGEITEWNPKNPKTQPSKEELIVLWDTFVKDNDYKEKRVLEYPPKDDILIALIEDREGDSKAIQSIMAQRKAIKDKYPKPDK